MTGTIRQDVKCFVAREFEQGRLPCRNCVYACPVFVTWYTELLLSC